jgi:pilus assembly protein CpaF
VPALDLGGERAGRPFLVRALGGRATAGELALSGRVYADSAPALVRELRTAHDAGVRDFVVDATSLLQLDFASIAAFVDLLALIRPAGGRVVFHGLRPHVLRMLQLTGVALLVDVVPGREAALRRLDDPPDPPPAEVRLDEVARRIHVLTRALPPDADPETPRRRLTRAAFDAFVKWVGDWGLPGGPGAEERIRRQARQLVEDASRDWTPPPPPEDVDHVARLLVDDVLGQGPLDGLLRDPLVSEIMVNGPDQVLVERDGQIVRTDLVFRDEEHLENDIRRMAERIGRRIDYANPTLDAFLEDGSRVHAVLPPVALDGACLTIRRFGVFTTQLEDLVLRGSLAPEMAYFLAASVKARLNLMIGGPASSGKTTAMNALASLVPRGERLVTIEEVAEMDLSRAHAHVVRLQCRTANVEGRGEVTIRQLVREALRMRADRILVGEARGAEMVEVLQAMRCGHDGSMTTIHASAPEGLIERAVTIALFANLGLTDETLRRLVVDGVDVIIFAHRFSDGSRRITCIGEPYRTSAGDVAINDVFVFEHEGFDEQGRSLGRFRFVNPSRYRQRFEHQGIAMPWDEFARLA